MSILALFVENYKKIRCAQFEFNGNSLIQIRGKNGAGKSSALEAIEDLFKGGRKSGDVVTRGEKESTIVGKFFDYTATRTIDEKGKSSLTVIKENFGELQAAQTFMDQIAGEFIDPVWFANLKGKDARETLIRYSGIDFVPIDAKIAQKEQNRTLKHREIKAAGVLTPCAKVEPVSVTELMEQRKEIEAFNDEQEKLNHNMRMAIIETQQSVIDLIDSVVVSEIKDTLECISKLDSTIIQAQKLYVDRSAIIKKMPLAQKEKSTAEIDEKLKKADEINGKAAFYKSYIENKNKRESLQDEYDALTKEIETLRKERSDMLTNAVLPLPGLEITDDNLMLNSISYDTLSTSEKLKVSLVLAARYAGELKTVFVHRGECLDTESLAKIEKFAKDHGLQIIMEIVDSSYSVKGDGVFQIEEGEIRIQ